MPQREGVVIRSENCLEFIYEVDGSCIHLVPLETLLILPKPGDVALLSGDRIGVGGTFRTGAYRIQRIDVAMRGSIDTPSVPKRRVSLRRLH